MNTKILRRLHSVGRVIGYLIGMSIYITLMLLVILGLTQLIK
jgi:hypothetical protein